MAYVQPADVSAILNAFSQLGQANAAEHNRDLQAQAQKAGTMGAIGGVAGGAIGTYFGGPMGGAAGAAIGSRALGGSQVGGAQTVQSAGQGYQMGQAYQEQQANKQAGAAVLAANAPPSQPQGTPDSALPNTSLNVQGDLSAPQSAAPSLGVSDAAFSDIGQGNPDASRQAALTSAMAPNPGAAKWGAYKYLQQAVASGTISPDKAAALSEAINPHATPITVAPGSTVYGFDKRTGTMQPMTPQTGPVLADAQGKLTTDLTQAKYQYNNKDQTWGPFNPQLAQMNRSQNTINQNYMSNIKDYRTLIPYAENINHAIQDPSPFGDYSMLYNVQKMLNPTSEVSETAASGLKNIGSFDTQVQKYAEQLASGKQFTPEQRVDLASVGQRHFQSMYQNYKIEQGNKRALALQEGYDPAVTVPDFEQIKPDELNKTVQKMAAAPKNTPIAATEAQAKKFPKGATYSRWDEESGKWKFYQNQ